MKRIVLVALACAALAGCDKYGSGGYWSHMVGNWVQVQLPAGCNVKQIAAEERGGVAVLCDDGRVFH